MKKYYQFSAQQKIQGTLNLLVGVEADSIEEAEKLVKSGQYQVDDSWCDYETQSEPYYITYIDEI